MTQKAGGALLRHDTIRNEILVLEDRKRPFGYVKQCRICMSEHDVKTFHLYLEADGQCMVSYGVLEDLKRMGMPEQLRVVGHEDNPPPLKLGRVGPKSGGVGDQITHREARAVVDNENRKIWVPPGTKLERGTDG